MSRPNLLLAVLLVALIALDLLTLPGQGPARVIGPLLPGLDTAAAAELELRADGTAPLVLRRDGEDWVLPATLGYAARTTLAEDLLTRLASLSTLDLVTEDAARHREYGVDQGTLVTVRDAEGQVLAELLQGDLTPDGRATYGRAPSEDRTYRLPLFAPVRLDPAWWLDARLLTFEPGLVRRVELVSGERALVLERDLARVGVWRTPAGDPAAGASVDSLLEALRSTFLDEVLEDRPLETSTWSVTLELADGSQRGLRVAASPAGGPAAAGVDASVLGGTYRVLLGAPGWRRLQAASAARSSEQPAALPAQSGHVRSCCGERARTARAHRGGLGGRRGVRRVNSLVPLRPLPRAALGRARMRRCSGPLPFLPHPSADTPSWTVVGGASWSGSEGSFSIAPTRRPSGVCALPLSGSRRT